MADAEGAVDDTDEVQDDVDEDVATSDEMTVEAVCRLRMLASMYGLDQDVVTAFKDSGKVMVSRRQVIHMQMNVGKGKGHEDRIMTRNCVIGALFDADDDERAIVDEFEGGFNCVVYHATREELEFGDIIDLFFISKYRSEWALDRSDLTEGIALVMAHNITDPVSSDIGTIGFKSSGGGLIRIA